MAELARDDRAPPKRRSSKRSRRARATGRRPSTRRRTRTIRSRPAWVERDAHFDSVEERALLAPALAMLAATRAVHPPHAVRPGAHPVGDRRRPSASARCTCRACWPPASRSCATTSTTSGRGLTGASRRRFPSHNAAFHVVIDGPMHRASRSAGRRMDDANRRQLGRVRAAPPSPERIVHDRSGGACADLRTTSARRA